MTISAEVKGFDPFDVFCPPQALVAVEPIDGKLVLQGCGARRTFEP